MRLRSALGTDFLSYLTRLDRNAANRLREGVALKEHGGYRDHRSRPLGGFGTRHLDEPSGREEDQFSGVLGCYWRLRDLGMPRPNRRSAIHGFRRRLGYRRPGWQ